MPQLYDVGLQVIEKEIKKRMNINEENNKLVLEVLILCILALYYSSI